MLILAGVTISIVINGGLFKQAQKAVDLTKEAAQNEQDMMNDVVDQISNSANNGGTGGNTSNTGEDGGTEGNTNNPGGSETVLPIIGDGSFDGAVNTPKLGTGMTPVAWNGTTEFTPATNTDWYSYTAQTGATTNGGTSQWANAKTTNGSYLVWIPRYEYQITSGYHGLTGSSSNPGTTPLASRRSRNNNCKIHSNHTNYSR